MINLIMALDLIKKSGIRDCGGEFQISEEFYPAMDKLAKELTDEAERRAKANERKTLRKQDLDCRVTADGRTDVVKKSGLRNQVDDVQISEDFYSVLNNRLKREIIRAKERSEANRRITLKPQDI
jgi:histone H3/H4